MKNTSTTVGKELNVESKPKMITADSHVQLTSPKSVLKKEATNVSNKTTAQVNTVQKVSVNITAQPKKVKTALIKPLAKKHETLLQKKVKNATQTVP